MKFLYKLYKKEKQLLPGRNAGQRLLRILRFYREGKIQI